jgi:hypothetical protein
MTKALLIILSVTLLFACSKDDDSTSSIGAFQIDFSEIKTGSVHVNVIGYNENDQAISSGLVWGLMENPEIDTSDNLLNSTVSGVFQETVYGLSKNTTYNFRAFQQTETDIIYSTVFSLTTLETCSGEIFEGDVILGSQRDVDAFDITNICGIEGELRFISTDVLDPILDFKKFSNLSSVITLSIFNNPELQDISGLQNIESVTEGINIFGNDLLTNIDPLSNISGSVQFINVYSNERLIHLDGLKNITSIGASANAFNVQDNLSLESLGSLDKLEQLISLYLVNNPSLVSLQFPSLTGEIEFIYIDSNGGLESINNLGSVNSIRDVAIFDCQLLENLDGFQQIETLESIYLEDSRIKNLNTMSNVISGSNATFVNNLELVDFCGLQTVIQNGGFQSFDSFGNAYNPSREDILNGNCSL